MPTTSTFYSTVGIDEKSHTLTGTYSWTSGGVTIGNGAAFTLDGIALKGIADSEIDLAGSNWIATRAWTRTYVESKVTAAVKFKGSKTFTELRTTAATVGDLYNITDAFTLGGKNYDAGTNLVCKQDVTLPLPSGSDPADYWDAYGSATVDLTPYLSKSEAALTYATKTEVSTTYATKAELTTSLAGYVAKTDIVENATLGTITITY